MKNFLGLKFIFIACAAGLSAFIGISTFFYSSFIHSFNDLDRNDLRDDAQRAHRTFSERFTFLESKVGDWGAWDEAFKYVATRDKSFEQANFTDTVVGSLKITAIAYLDKDLAVIGAREMINGKLVVLDPATIDFFQPTHPLVTNSESSIAYGIVDFKGRPALAAASVVSLGDGSGPPAGRVLFVRAIDDEMLKSLSDQTLLEVTMSRENSVQSFATAGRIEFDHGEIAVHETFGLATIPLHSMTGDRLAVLNVKIPRDIAIFGRQSARNILVIFSLFIAGLVLVIVVILRNAGVRETLNRTLHAKELLETRDAYQRALIESVPGFVSWFDDSLHYLGVNRRLADYYGLDTSEFAGKPIGFQHQKSEPDLKGELQALFSDPANTSRQSQIFLDGPTERRRFLICIEKYDRGRRAVVVGIDLTASWKAEEQAARDRQFAVNAARLSALGEMAGGIAHEINNPLAIIQASCRKLSRQLQSAQIDSSDKLVMQIESTCMRIAKIISGLRAFARDGSSDPFSVVSVKSIIDDLDSLCIHRLKSHGVELRIGKINENIAVKCRQVQIGQVLVNLVNNSFDAIFELNERWISIDVVETTGLVEIAVTDSGRGIPAEVVEKMMNPFFTTKSVGKGTGLGLSISLGIMKDHQGDLIYDRTCAHTRFVLQLVAAATDQHRNNSQAA